MADDKRATLFMNGGSQAVRLPKEFRLPGTAVRVRRVGDGVLLEPLEKRAWPAGYWERLASLPPLPEDITVPPPLPPPADRDARLAALEVLSDSGPRPARSARRRGKPRKRR